MKRDVGGIIRDVGDSFRPAYELRCVAGKKNTC